MTRQTVQELRDELMDELGAIKKALNELKDLRNLKERSEGAYISQEGNGEHVAGEQGSQISEQKAGAKAGAAGAIPALQQH